MEGETMMWSEAIKIPSPDSVLAIFWQLMIYFWKAELDDDFYRARAFPISVEEVRLRIDHRFYQRARYHVLEIREGEAAGVWDTTPFSVDFGSFSHAHFLEHGDYRHAYQLFLRSFLKILRRQALYHPSLLLMKRILMQLPILKWKCPVCKKYNQWSRSFIETQLLEHNLSIAPSTLSYLLTYRNEGLRSGEETVDPDQLDEFLPILTETLRRFFTDFEKIYEQTSMDPVHILKNLIDILGKHAQPFAMMEEIEKYETACSKEMKSYLFYQFKFLKTRSLKISHFPRTMMILREVFTSIMNIWRQTVRDEITTNRSSPGTVILLGYLLFRDPVLDTSHDTPILVVYPTSIDRPVIRAMVPPEIEQLRDYHPVLRPYLFLSV